MFFKDKKNTKPNSWQPKEKTFFLSKGKKEKKNF